MSNTHTLAGAMQDGRFFTDYSPVCKLNAEIASKASIPSWNSSEYRSFLQKNGLGLINNKKADSPCGALDCSHNGIAIQDPPQVITSPYTEDPEL